MANQPNQSQNPINKIIAWLGKHLLPWDDVSLVRLKKIYGTEMCIGRN